MVEWSIAAFRAASVGAILVACPPGHVLGESGGGEGSELRVVEGGRTRSESVANALAEVGTELVAIHDAARPLLTAAAGSSTGDPSASQVASYRVHRDTNSPLEVERTLDRDRLWAAQTPQVFRVDALRAALEARGEAVGWATDEAMLVEAAGGRVLICPAPPENLKVTTRRDLRLAEQLLEERRVQEGGAKEESSAK
jgi:2-C-methyl-D-erythritol 4-phosphate cytidylyltransferase